MTMQKNLTTHNLKSETTKGRNETLKKPYYPQPLIVSYRRARADQETVSNSWPLSLLFIFILFACF